MLVRYKKRGEFPNHASGTIYTFNGIRIAELFRGQCVEVIPFNGIDTWNCSGKKFQITDSRMLSLLPQPKLGEVDIICEHYLIDDLEAYDSDYCDEQAQEGDLAFVQEVQHVRR